jgi:glucose-1-phosphate cytidylyltransferase
MKVVILAGGLGTRIGEESRFRPKPMIELGGMPILWHVMKLYSHYGFTDFVICAGYRQEIIKQWFSDYFINRSDVTFNFKEGKSDVEFYESNCEPWRVTIADTGLSTMTGGRIKRIQKYVGNERFFMTYGDGVCDVNIGKLLEFHKSHGKLATLTAVKLGQDKGVLNIGGDNAVKAFREKNLVDAPPINAGFMVLEPQVFDYIDGDDQPFEREPLERLAEDGELMSYVHNGFWQCMDNVREKETLEQLLAQNKAPWKVW